MNYASTYAKLLALAKRPARDCRGKKFNSYYWIRLDPQDHTRFALGYYRSRGANYNIRVPRKDQVFFPCIEFDNEGFTVIKFEHRTVSAPPGYKEKYGESEWQLGRDTYVDIGTNNLLYYALGGVFLTHKGNGVAGKPGFLWTLFDQEPINIVGAVRYDATTNTISATKTQPTKIVNTELRTHVAKLLRATYRRQRVLSRIGIEITAQAIQELVGSDTPVRPYHEFMASDARKYWTDPYKLLNAMERYDCHDKHSTTEIVARIYALNTYYSFTVWSLTGASTGAPLLDTPGRLERTRRALYKALNIVEYK